MITRIDIDGMDRTGKDTLCKYICELSNYKYIVNTRGILSQIAYDNLYERGRDYTNEISDNKNTLIIYLEANFEDLEIRFKMTREPKIPLMENLQAFNYGVNVLLENGITVITFNTSTKTPYDIAQRVIRYLEQEANK